VNEVLSFILLSILYNLKCLFSLFPLFDIFYAQAPSTICLLFND